ncbi:hypothetical protein [Hyphobacterium marinum]|uniref:Uncharacterized protein n=1 Tax=Hyphobacterium marinum TaxID=3116574 RepID=A0ABU7M2T6_9PROT|nr:hypothetical protein [Hyphobacterium sp. Y6023]MEE2567715.1 hypothetical protein [Hyphobacterium sp. Y6023]
MMRLMIVLAGFVLAVSAADAQQRAVIRAQTANDTNFTAEFQAAMENGDYGAAATMVREGTATGSGRATGRRQHGAASASGASSAMSVAANTPPPDTAEYTCNSGNCACAGASDCVAMAPICAEGTIGCNDYGCTCQEAE